jgi:hypothetical protein
MTDRELLELAAKAAGLPVYESDDGTLQARPILAMKHGGGNGTMPYEQEWNPLRDDAEAFRLAVKLNLTTRYEPEPDGAIVKVGALWHDEFPDYWWNEWLEKDAAAATRRAIVRAAADIGSKP